MNGFLIDTNVLSEYNRTGVPDSGVKHWLETTDRQTQFVSVITLAEIQKGIELLAEGKRRSQLEQWLTYDLDIGPCGACDGNPKLVRLSLLARSPPS